MHPHTHTHTHTHIHSLSHTHTHTLTAGSLAIAEGSESEKLHAVLKDLASILQALGRLAEHFIDTFYESRLSEAQLLMKKFCMLADYSAKLQLFNVTTPMPEILDHDFIEL